MNRIQLLDDIRHPRSTLRHSGFLASIVLILMITAPLPILADSSPTIRILLGEEPARVAVRGSSLLIEKQDRGNWVPVLSSVRWVEFSPAQGGVHLEGSSVYARTIRVRSREGLLGYAGRQYRGYLTVMLKSDKLMVVSHLPLESYLAGVVNGEIDSSWPMEALKAQVVAARSYALYQMNARSPYYDLKTDVTDQVYAGPDSEDERAVDAVRMTRGQILYGEGGPIPAFYHSSCGGSTASARELWGFPQPAQEGVYCGQCQEAPYANWKLSLDVEEIVDTVMTLYPNIDNVRSMGVHRRTRDGRIQTLFVETGRSRVLVDAGEFRKALGYRKLPSTRFSLGTSGDRIVLTGEGYGHGVGLCQWGARGSALKGMDYSQILRKYYPGTEIRRAY